MNDNRYKWILYAIVAVITITIGIQVFWNYKNYQTNKQQLIIDVQISLDKAVDDYYADLAERTTLGISLVGDAQMNAFGEDSELTKFLEQIDETTNEFKNLDSLDVNNLDGLTIFRGRKADSMMSAYNQEHMPTDIDSFKFKVDQIKQNDSIDFESFELLTSKIVVSINNDSLDLKKLDTLLSAELDRKNLTIENRLIYHQGNSVPKEIQSRLDTLLSDVTKPKTEFTLSTTSKSTFLPKDSTLELQFNNSRVTILKRSLAGIFISTLLILAVISCLFYLLKVIKHQKQLAEVKNDLISNITHEFKTPIATIGVALESISNFNGIDDKAKTQKYIGMSSEQLSKLNTMVEKLLETATLDSDSLKLNKESVNMVELLTSLTNRYKIRFTKKSFNESYKVNQLMAIVDLFHFENALNNILDNAVKYGGEIISIDLLPRDNTFEIHISDNGNNLSKANKDKIFEKFYRVQKGNTHDVKGFGIGLYYTKTIVEKHGGLIDIDLSNQLTTFKITLPNG